MGAERCDGLRSEAHGITLELHQPEMPHLGIRDAGGAQCAEGAILQETQDVGQGRLLMFHWAGA